MKTMSNYIFEKSRWDYDISDGSHRNIQWSAYEHRHAQKKTASAEMFK
jgi:hypothetical protein